MLVFFLFGFYYNIFITTKIHSKGIFIKEKKKKCRKNKPKKKKPQNQKTFVLIRTNPMNKRVFQKCC